jgi:hypothetical protein
MPLPQANAMVCDQPRRSIKEFLGRGMGFTPLRQGGLAAKVQGRDVRRGGPAAAEMESDRRILDREPTTRPLLGAAFNAPDAVVKHHLS